MAFAEHQFTLNKSGKDGISLREHLEQVERQTGIRPSDLDGPDFPTQMSHIWSAFYDLHNARSMGFSGPNPLSYAEIKSWMELTETPLTAFDVEVLKKIDVEYLKVMT